MLNVSIKEHIRRGTGSSYKTCPGEHSSLHHKDVGIRTSLGPDRLCPTIVPPRYFTDQIRSLLRLSNQDPELMV